MTKKTDRLSNLSHLYNLITDPALRYALFAAVLEYALATDQTPAVEGQFETIDARLKELNVTMAQKRRIYEIVLKHVKDWRSVYVYDLWVKYFSAYDEGEPVSVEVQKEAHNYIVSVIKDSEIIRTDLLLESYAVQSLKSSQYKMTFFPFGDIYYKRI